MGVVGIRQLSRETSRVIQKFEETGEPVVITREGQPIGALMPVDRAQLQDIVLATAPKSLELHERAKADLAEGQTRSLEEAAAARNIDLPAREPQSHEQEPAEVDPQVVAEELGGFPDIFNEGVARTMTSDVSREAGALSDEALATIREATDEQPAPGEVRELSELTASVYGRFFRQYLSKKLARGEIERAVELSHRQTRDALLVVGRSMTRRGEVTFDRYVGSLQGIEATLSSQIGEDRGGATSDPHASSLESPFSVDS